MEWMFIVALILTYVIIGRVLAEIYTKYEGYSPMYKEEDIFIRTFMWPFLLFFWGLSKLVERICR